MLGIFSSHRKRSWKGDRLLRADLCALLALDAFRGTGFQRVFSNRPHGAGLLTDHALIAVLADPALKNPQGRDQAEQGAQGTEVAAPEPRGQAIEGDDSPKDQERQGRHIIDGLRIVKVREGNPSQLLEKADGADPRTD